MQIRNPFHPGEKQIQERAGEAAKAGLNGAMIADTIMAGALPFLRQQRMLVIGSASPLGNLWASILFGRPGFVESEDGKTLRIHLSKESRDNADPLWKNIAPGKSLGSLAIDLATRRRLRINGRVVVGEPDLLTMEVDEAYPNCPKYIQRRLFKRLPDSHRGQIGITSGDVITGAVRDIVEKADTLFVASANPRGGADVSHRGGRPGFVRVVDEHTISVPDYQGNGLFNTLGNFAVNPAAGILIIDFPNHQTLQMTGEAHIQWIHAAGREEGETDRSWTFRATHWLLRPLPAAMQFEFVDFSPYNPS
ncbi:MAG TPA: pyridoxamine 5'-phosphate oxidase family protein [Terriglobia bacterium]|nr:pyridoxamine 5'-phosphate oxidase family protein [Terriglobia bacterium]